MKRARLEELRDLYRRELLDSVIPFWTKHSLDSEHGGYLTCLERDGSVFGTDKQVWGQGRGTWVLWRTR